MTRRLMIPLIAAMAGSTAHSGFAAELNTWASADLPPLRQFAAGQPVRTLEERHSWATDPKAEDWTAGKRKRKPK